MTVSLFFLYSSPSQSLLFSYCWLGAGSERHFQGNVPDTPVGTILGPQMLSLEHLWKIRWRKPGAATTITDNSNDPNHAHQERS